jgi:Na+-transporting NADH:ubiquinone oxidoreductase subunit NqrA
LKAFSNVFMTPHKSGTVTETHRKMKRAFMTSNLYEAVFSGR